MYWTVLRKLRAVAGFGHSASRTAALAFFLSFRWQLRGRYAGQYVPCAVEVVDVEPEHLGLDLSLDAATSELVEERFGANRLAVC